MALIYTKNHPEKVNSLILTASSGLYENAFGSSFPRREDKEFIRKKVALTFYDPAHATDELVDECFEMVNDRNADGIFKTFQFPKYGSAVCPRAGMGQVEMILMDRYLYLMSYQFSILSFL